VCQVRIDRWSRGRVALIGDAAFCPSLLAGEGASLAMAAAYLLAGELKKADGAPDVAFREYERKFRPFIEEKQRSAEQFARWFAPKGRLGIYVRNFAIRMTSSPRLAKWAMGRIISDRLALPDY
jgi:2-polyprenyl-6-methoxyphenol hydroxylase-like FAD-dependent oxidoreductase